METGIELRPRPQLIPSSPDQLTVAEPKFFCDSTAPVDAFKQQSRPREDREPQSTDRDVSSSKVLVWTQTTENACLAVACFY